MALEGFRIYKDGSEAGIEDMLKDLGLEEEYWPGIRHKLLFLMDEDGWLYIGSDYTPLRSIGLPEGYEIREVE